MKKLCLASLLLVSGLAQAQAAEWDYTNTLSGTITELLSGNPIAGNQVFDTQQVTGTYAVSLIVANNNALRLVSYDIDLTMSNGVTFSDMTGSDLTNPAFQTSTGAQTCAIESFEISGCIFLKQNGTATIAAESAYQASAQLGVNLGPDRVVFSNLFCGAVPAYMVTITGNKNGVCSAELSSDTAGKWTMKTGTGTGGGTGTGTGSVSAPEVEAASAPALLSMLAGLLVVARGSTRRARLTPPR